MVYVVDGLIWYDRWDVTGVVVGLVLSNWDGVSCVTGGLLLLTLVADGPMLFD